MSFFEQSGHFYAVDGNTISSAYDAGLKEARQRRLYVSPTTVAQVRANPGLDAWKQGLLVDTVLSHPQVPDESIEDYKKRIKELARKPATDAADFGTRIHDAIEHYPQLPLDADLHPWFDQYALWHEANVAEVIGNETMLAHHGIGVAGKTDKLAVMKTGRIAVLDYKTQKVKAKGPAFYDSWASQLSFYGRSYQLRETLPEMPDCINIVIDSTNPSPVVPKAWTPQEIKLAWGEFLCCAWMWQKEKNYWPVGQWEIGDWWAL